MVKTDSQGALHHMTNEAFSRVKIDAQLRDQGWEITNTNAVRFEYVLPDRTKDQAKAYAAQLKVPYIFLANGDETEKALA